MRKAGLVAVLAVAVSALLLLSRRTVPSPPEEARSKLPGATTSEAPAVERDTVASAPPLPARTLDVPRVLATLVARYKRSLEAPELQAHHARGRFGEEEVTGLREGRLLALARPEEVERWAERTAFDPALPHVEREYALRLAGVLARSGRTGAEGVLLRLARDADRGMSEAALRELASADRGGRHAALYLDRARSGSVEAVDALGHAADAASRPLLEELYAAGRDASDLPGELSAVARRSLERQAVLRAPDRLAQLEEILREPEGPRFKMGGWALRAAREAGLSTLAPALRARLDRTAGEIGRRLAAGLAPDEDSDLEKRWVTDGNLGLFGGDLFYDDALVALQELGGPLTELEQARLRHFGYGVDPASRLAELLPE